MIDMPMQAGMILPEFTLRKKDFPKIESWDVGEEHYLVLKVEMVGKRNRKDMVDPRSKSRVMSGDFQIKSVSELTDKPVDAGSMEKKAFERAVTKAKSGSGL